MAGARPREDPVACGHWSGRGGTSAGSGGPARWSSLVAGAAWRCLRAEEVRGYSFRRRACRRVAGRTDRCWRQGRSLGDARVLEFIDI